MRVATHRRQRPGDAALAAAAVRAELSRADARERRLRLHGGDEQRQRVAGIRIAACRRSRSLSTGTYSHAPDWYRNFLYTEEAARGLDCIEDLASPGIFTFDIAQRDAALVLRAGNDVAGDARSIAAETFASERKRRSPLAHLDRAADAYVVQAGARRTIIAGYPWFTDWGRDTFIAMRGLLLARGPADVASMILEDWAGHVSRGHAAQSLSGRQRDAAVQRGRRLAMVRDRGARDDGDRRHRASGSSDAIAAILDGYARGTRYGIRMDEDGLLACGEPGLQLTWMDARVDGRVITPRIGKPVEVQALWINALRLAGRDADSPTARSAAFRARFVNAAGGGLYDVVDADHVAGPRRRERAAQPDLRRRRAALRTVDGETRAPWCATVETERWSRRRACAPSRLPIPRTARATKADPCSATAPITRAPCGRGSSARSSMRGCACTASDADVEGASAAALRRTARGARRSGGHRPPVRDRGRRRAAHAARMPVPGVVAGRAHPREEADRVTRRAARRRISREAPARRVIRPARDIAPRTLSPAPSSSRPSLIARVCTRFQRG